MSQQTSFSPWLSQVENKLGRDTTSGEYLLLVRLWTMGFPALKAAEILDGLTIITSRV